MRLVLTVLSVGVLAAGCTEARTVQMDDIVKTLRQGGHVLVMRHASSPRETPSDGIASPDNPKLERQLDEMGRRGATEMGEAITRLLPRGADRASRSRQEHAGGGGIAGRVAAREGHREAAVRKHAARDASTEFRAGVSRLGIDRG